MVSVVDLHIIGWDIGLGDVLRFPNAIQVLYYVIFLHRYARIRSQFYDEVTRVDCVLFLQQIQQLETQVIDAEKRAFTAHQQVVLQIKVSSPVLLVCCQISSCVLCVYLGRQVQWMEEKLKAPDGQSGDSEMCLFQRCQELQSSVQEKENVIAQLEQQLEEQVEHTH